MLLQHETCGTVSVILIAAMCLTSGHESRKRQVEAAMHITGGRRRSEVFSVVHILRRMRRNEETLAFVSTDSLGQGTADGNIFAEIVDTTTSTRTLSTTSVESTTITSATSASSTSIDTTAATTSFTDSSTSTANSSSSVTTANASSTIASTASSIGSDSMIETTTISLSLFQLSRFGFAKIRNGVLEPPQDDGMNSTLNRQLHFASRKSKLWQPLYLRLRNGTIIRRPLMLPTATTTADTSTSDTTIDPFSSSTTASISTSSDMTSTSTTSSIDRKDTISLTTLTSISTTLNMSSSTSTRSPLADTFTSTVALDTSSPTSSTLTAASRTTSATTVSSKTTDATPQNTTLSAAANTTTKHHHGHGHISRNRWKSKGLNGIISSKEFFDGLDPNSNGQIRLSDIAAFSLFPSYKQGKSIPPDEWFAETDVNNDGKVTWDEAFENLPGGILIN